MKPLKVARKVWRQSRRTANGDTMLLLGLPKARGLTEFFKQATIL